MNNTITVKSRLRRLIIISIAAVTLIVCVTGIVVSAISIKKKYRVQAESVTAHIKEALENGNADWNYDSENDVVSCNGNEVDVNLFIEINNVDKDVFHTIFWDDTRVLTNIKNEEGNYAVGTQADKKIYEAVKSGKTYTKNGVKIFGNKYTVCYMPIYNGNDFVGMMFTGINQKAVTTSVLTIGLSMLAGSIFVLVIMIFVSNKVLNNIAGQLTGKLNDGYDKLNEFAGGIMEISDRTNKEVEEITKAMGNVAAEATSNAAASQEASESTEEFASSIDRVNEEINESYNFIETIKECVNESEESICDLNDSIDSNNKIVDDISVDIEEGVENTRKAKSIVKTIDNLAFQINLLALNASVEASHAGEFGMGFAVVADEIKKLAGSSAESAKDTADIIADIVGTMTKTQDSNQKLVEANKEQLKKAEDVRAKMGQLRKTIEELVEKLNLIKINSDSLDHVKDELVQVIQAISTASEENAAISEEVSASTDTVENDIENLVEGITKINEICKGIQETIEYFG